MQGHGLVVDVVALTKTSVVINVVKKDISQEIVEVVVVPEMEAIEVADVIIAMSQGMNAVTDPGQETEDTEDPEVGLDHVIEAEDIKVPQRLTSFLFQNELIEGSYKSKSLQRTSRYLFLEIFRIFYSETLTYVY